MRTAITRVREFWVFFYNRPTSTILAGRLTPRILGALVALYEHSVFTQGVIWGIDSFDQWGSSSERALAQRIGGELEREAPPADGHDSSTTNRCVATCSRVKPAAGNTRRSRCVRRRTHSCITRDW